MVAKPAKTIQMPKQEVQSVQLKFFKPATEEDKQRKTRSSILNDSELFKETTQVVNMLANKAEGLKPYEVGLTIDVDDPEIQQQLKGLKKPFHAYLHKLRLLLRSNKIKNVRIATHGSKIILIGEE